MWNIGFVHNRLFFFRSIGMQRFTVAFETFIQKMPLAIGVNGIEWIKLRQEIETSNQILFYTYFYQFFLIQFVYFANRTHKIFNQ